MVGKLPPVLSWNWDGTLIGENLRPLREQILPWKSTITGSGAVVTSRMFVAPGVSKGKTYYISGVGHVSSLNFCQV